MNNQADIIPISKHVRALWSDLGDTPVDENDCITEIFGGFPPGTHREDIWHWFEEAFSIPVHSLMLPTNA